MIANQSCQGWQITVGGVEVPQLTTEDRTKIAESKGSGYVTVELCIQKMPKKMDGLGVSMLFQESTGDRQWMYEASTPELYNTLISRDPQAMIKAVTWIKEHLNGDHPTDVYQCQYSENFGRSDLWVTLRPGESYISFDNQKELTFYSRDAAGHEIEQKHLCAYVMAYMPVEEGIFPTQCGLIPLTWGNFKKCPYGIELFTQKLDSMIANNFTAIVQVLNHAKLFFDQKASSSTLSDAGSEDDGIIIDVLQARA